VGLSLAMPAVRAFADGPAAAATPAAPTTQRAALVEATPPGFVRVNAGRYSAFCLAADEPWVKQSLAQIKPAQMPTTRPSDILSKIPGARAAIAKGLSDDVGIDPATTNSLFDEQLIPQLTKLDELQPPVVFFVVTKQKLVGLINADWKHPRIGYNRLMDQIRFDDRVTLSTDGPLDETLLLSIYDPTSDLAARTKLVRSAAEQFESETAFSVAARSRGVTQVSIAQFIEKNVFVPLKLRDDQSWLQLGTVTLLAAKYAPMLTGADPKQMLADLIYERPDAEPSAARIDMLDLPDLNQLQPRYRMAWINAARRKSTLAVQQLVEKAGSGAIKKVLASIKKNQPKDGASMIALITGVTDVDLSDSLRLKRQ